MGLRVYNGLWSAGLERKVREMRIWDGIPSGTGEGRGEWGGEEGGRIWVIRRGKGLRVSRGRWRGVMGRCGRREGYILLLGGSGRSSALEVVRR
jgi:hypothetical protein